MNTILAGLTDAHFLGEGLVPHFELDVIPCDDHVATQVLTIMADHNNQYLVHQERPNLPVQRLAKFFPCLDVRLW